MNDEIGKYYSVVGNSDVPYPIAIGEKYVYHMCECVYADRRWFLDQTGNPLSDKDLKNCASIFYGHESKYLNIANKQMALEIKILVARLW
jgi:hypothetical protein